MVWPELTGAWGPAGAKTRCREPAWHILGRAVREQGGQYEDKRSEGKWTHTRTDPGKTPAFPLSENGGLGGSKSDKACPLAAVRGPTGVDAHRLPRRLES